MEGLQQRTWLPLQPGASCCPPPFINANFPFMISHPSPHPMCVYLRAFSHPEDAHMSRSRRIPAPFPGSPAQVSDPEPGLWFTAHRQSFPSARARAHLLHPPRQPEGRVRERLFFVILSTPGLASGAQATPCPHTHTVGTAVGCPRAGPGIVCSLLLRLTAHASI